MDYLDYLINEEATLLDAMHQLDETAQKVLFIVDEQHRLVAAVSDGDVRRSILSNGNLEAPVKSFANYSPKYIDLEHLPRAQSVLRKDNILALPVVDSNGHMVDIVFWNDEEQTSALMPHLDLPVVINAGGLGTRLFPYTKILPKPLIPIGDMPIAEHIIRHFAQIGCREFYMIVNHKKNMIKAYFNEIEKDYSLCFVDEEKPLGTGGGLSLMQGMLHRPFIFANCDTIILTDFEKVYRAHQAGGRMITMICATKEFTIPYGTVETGADGAITALNEKPRMSFLTNTGCYIVEPAVVERMEKAAAIDFPDVIENNRQSGERVGIYPISENDWLDMGQFDQLEVMKKRLGVDE